MQALVAAPRSLRLVTFEFFDASDICDTGKGGQLLATPDTSVVRVSRAQQGTSLISVDVWIFLGHSIK